MAAVAALVLTLTAYAAPQKPAAEPAPSPASAEGLLQTRETILGEPIVYPADTPAEMTIAIVTLESGASTRWNRHAVPLAASLLKGELTVIYEGQGPRV